MDMIRGITPMEKIYLGVDIFKGPVSNNILEVLNHSRSNTSGANGFVLNGEEIVNIPKIGKRNVKFTEYYNNHSNAGSLGCCPNLFYYHDGYITGVESSTSYTYSIIYKHTGNYTHPNFMYRYEYQTNGTYNTEGGFHSTASDRRRHLGNGWYHAWGTFTTQSTTTQLRCYSFLYNYGTTKHKFYVAAISLVKNTSGSTHLIVPPHLMLKPNTSVSSTQSLIDLKKSTNIDTANVSFDSTGQPTFDGTDDQIVTTAVGITNYSQPFSMECVFKVPTSGTNGLITVTVMYFQLLEVMQVNTEFINTGQMVLDSKLEMLLQVHIQVQQDMLKVFSTML